MSEDFRDARVLVTGAGRGLGRGVAEAFATAGAKVMLGSRTLEPAEEAAAAIRAAGGTAQALRCDVTRHDECRALVEATASAFGGVDVIIHCAADIPHGGLGHVSDEKLESGLASIAKAAWWLLDAARPHLASAPGGGRFIAIGSVNGTATVVPNMTAYGMAKAALLAFVRGAAIDVVDDGITVNAIQPGLVASDNALRVLGEEGLANLPEPVAITMRKEARLQNELLVDWKDRFVDSYDVELNDFIQAAARGTAAGPTSWDGYVAAITSDACVAAQEREGETVAITLPARPALYD